jgi:hypothetical protein
MSEPRLTNCFDTSSLLEPWNHRYPVEHFPSFWNALDGLIREKRMIATEEVREEIFRIDDGLTKWCTERRSVFVPLDATIQITTKSILKNHPKLTDTVKGRGRADAFVIALASSTRTMVVTEEKGGTKHQKIPEVCAALGIQCTNILGVIRREGWRF